VELLADPVEPITDQHDVPAGATERHRRRASRGPGAQHRDPFDAREKLTTYARQK
jgi:hypothetical protein